MVYSTVSNTLARSRGRPRSAKLSRPSNSGEADAMNGACEAAATCDICSMKYMSSGWRVISKLPSKAPNGAPPKVPNSSS
ncbi:hypothetical protein D3C73_1076620 [compost metagenome]